MLLKRAPAKVLRNGARKTLNLISKWSRSKGLLADAPQANNMLGIVLIVLAVLLIAGVASQFESQP